MPRPEVEHKFVTLQATVARQSCRSIEEKVHGHNFSVKTYCIHILLYICLNPYLNYSSFYYMGGQSHCNVRYTFYPGLYRRVRTGHRPHCLNGISYKRMMIYERVRVRVVGRVFQLIHEGRQLVHTGLSAPTQYRANRAYFKIKNIAKDLSKLEVIIQSQECCHTQSQYQ